MIDHDFYLLVDRLVIHNGNAISSPLTYGFPAISGFLGAVHRLERKVPFDITITFNGVLITSHSCRVKRYQATSYNDYTLNQSRNPIKKDGKSAAIIEEGKADLIVSLVIPIACDDYDDSDWIEDNPKTFTDWVKKTLFLQPMASGSVFDIAEVKLVKPENLDNLKARLAPGFILTDAKQDLIEITQQLQQSTPDATELDALLELATLHHIPETKPDTQSEKNTKTSWSVNNVKQGRGWLVPIPVGYQAISPLFEPGMLQESRTQQYPSQFVETLYGLGKWQFPYSVASLESAFWRMCSADNGLYLVEQTHDLAKESYHD